MRDERPVVVREPLREPQLAGRIRRVELERLERARPHALDVPAVKELVGGGAERAELLVRHAKTGGLGQDGAVAMLHPVGRRPRQKIRNERVGLLVGRQLAEHRARLAHDLLESRRKPVGIRVAAVVVERDPKLTLDREGPQRERAQLCRAVDQVLQVARGERSRIRGRMQLRGDLPRRRARRT